MLRKRMLKILLMIAFVFFSQMGFTQVKKYTLRVDGLACPFCAYGLEKKIMKIKGVKSFDYDLKQAKVFIEPTPGNSIRKADFNKAVKKAGFSLKSISIKVNGKISAGKWGLVLVSDQIEYLLLPNDLFFKEQKKVKIKKKFNSAYLSQLLESQNPAKDVEIEGILNESKSGILSISIQSIKTKNGE